MAPPGDLRAWIALLEREGELVRVSAEVDADLEITEINDRVVKAGGPALLFENVKGSSHPLLINQFGTERRMCLAFGAASLDEVARRLGDVLEMQPPEGLVAKVKGLQKLKSIADSRPKTVRGGPALLFENVKGSSNPLLINQFGTERRMCLAFGAASLDEVARRLGDVLEMQPPEGLVAKVKGLQKLKSIADSRPKTVRGGPAQEVVLTGDDVDLDLLPIQRCWPGDPAPFITLPAVITHDPRDGTRNVGMYRMQKVDRRTTLMHWQIHKDGRADYLFANGRLEVAVALGLDPVSAYSASAPLPKHIDEFMLAGFLKGSAVELTPAKTISVDVPANAEVVLEGYVETGDLAPEGPFGDHTGYYTGVEPFPVFHVTALTMRRDAIYPSIVVGKPPQEDAWLGKATERIFLPAIRMSVPELVDYDLPVSGAFHNCCIVSIRKQFPGHAQKVMHAIWGLGLLSLTKSVVVVDEGVDVHDYEEVFFRVCANVDPKRDVLLTEGPLDHLDHAPTLQFYGGKLGIDATHKGAAEGTREWPPEIEMSPEVRDLVTRRWEEYGIGLAPAARDGQISQSLEAPPLVRR